jgi:hypothetical protein
MGGRRWFNVESKSFEFVLESPGVRIIERGHNNVSNLNLGKEGVKWIRKGMADIISLPHDHSFARTCREEGRDFVLQKNKNSRANLCQ